MVMQPVAVLSWHILFLTDFLFANPAGRYSVIGFQNKHMGAYIQYEGDTTT